MKGKLMAGLDGASCEGAIRLGVSLVGFRRRGYDAIKSFIDYSRNELSVEPYFELPYILSSEELDQLEFLKGNVISVHAPCPGKEYFPNLGSNDERVVRDSIELIEKSAETAVRFGASFIVLHPGYATDNGVYMNSRERETELDGISREASNYIKLKKGSVCTHEYIYSKDYKRHFETALKNLMKATIACKERGIRLAIENLNPRISYLFQTVEEIVYALDIIPGLYTCIDIGHLWISSLIHNFDFKHELLRAALSGKVISTHVQNNSSLLVPEPYIADEHAVLEKGVIPIREAVRILVDNGVKHFVIESIADPEVSPEKNFKTLAEYIGLL